MYINPLHAIVIFIAVLFIYFQIQYHYKITPDEDVNIYELTQDLAKKHFDRVCDTDRIPFIFNFFETPAILRFMDATDFTTCRSVPIHIRQGTIANFKTVPFIRGMELMNTPATGNIISERNSELLKALHIATFLKRRDSYLRPGLCQYIDYDLLMGGPGSSTPLRYEINQRTFFMVTEGVAYVRLIHPAVAAAEFRPNEEPECDNRLMEYHSTADIWHPRTAQRLTCIHLTIRTGQTIYIPPFWWYSIRFVQGTGTRVLRLSYRNLINSLVLSPYFIAHKVYAFSEGTSDDSPTVSKTKANSAPVVTKSALKKKSKRRGAVTFNTPTDPETSESIIPTPAPAPAPTAPTTPAPITTQEIPPSPPLDAAAVESDDATTPLEPPTSQPHTLQHPSGFVIPLHAPMPDPLPAPTEQPKNPKAPNLERLLAQLYNPNGDAMHSID